MYSTKKLLLVFAVTVFAPAFLAAQLPTGTISGQLLSREGQPAAGIRVSAMVVPEAGAQTPAASGLVGISMTDSMGRYRLESIPPGRYYVVSGLVDLPTYYPGVSSINGATVLNVLSGTPITGINFTMTVPAGVAVRGRLVFTNGSPATVVTGVGLLGGVGGGQVLNSSVRADGSFEFLRVRPGTYQVLLSGGSFSSQPAPVVVADKDVTGIEIQILPTVIVTGSVDVEGNGLRPRLTINFSPFKGTAGGVPTAIPASNGTFRVILPEGDYRIGWGNLPAGYEVKSITAGTTDLLSTNLKLSTSASPPPIVVSLGVGEKPPWAKVSGKVTGLPALQNGLPYRLSLTGSALADVSDVPINPDGSFEFSRLLPGSYSARITPALPVGPTTFALGNRDLTDLSIAIPPLKEVRGVISNATSTSAIPGVAIRLMWTESSGSTSTSVAATQPDRTFTFLLPEGERRVTLTVPGYAVQSFTYGSVDLLKEPLKVSLSDVGEFRVTVAAPGGSTGVVGGVLGGVAGGAVLGGIIAPPSSPNPVAGVAAAAPVVTRISDVVAQANLISSLPPIYPAPAREARIEGVVELQIQISKDGLVEDARARSGHPLLYDAAIQAVRQWRYRPHAPNGQAIPVQTSVTVKFALQ